MIAIAFAVALSPAACLYKHEMAHAAGWPSNHKPAIYTKVCGGLPMPAKEYRLKKTQKPIIYYVPYRTMWLHCGPWTQACSSIGGKRPVIYLPKEAK